MRHGIDRPYNIGSRLIKLSQETGIKFIATKITIYASKGDCPMPTEGVLCV